MRRPLLIFFTVLAMLLLAACASQPERSQQQSQYSNHNEDTFFPTPPELQPQIAFWRKVYAVWGRNKVAIHDDRYMDLIYEVVTLPGTTQARYTHAQKTLVKSRYRYIKRLLQQVERKTRSNQPLLPFEQVLVSRIRASSGGANAIYGASQRLHRQRGLRERFKRGLEISGRYDAEFRRIFRRAGLPGDLAFLPHVESSFQNHAASSAGAAGMWQFMPSTARRYMTVNSLLDERLDPIISAQSAARYLGDAYSDLGNWSLAITSYNHGVGGMKRARNEMGHDIARIVRFYSGRSFGFASRNFYTEFLAAREVARNYKRYFPEGVRFQRPLREDRIRLRRAATPQTIASYYQVSVYELNRINRPWKSKAKRGYAPLPAGSVVWLPAGTIDRLVQRGMAGQAMVLADPITTGRQRHLR